MSSKIADKLSDAGHSVVEGAKSAGQAVAEGAKTVGHKIADGAGQAADWVKEKTGIGSDKSCGSSSFGADAIKERMDVIASCGKKVGVVDHIEGNAIKLTRNDSSDGMHHFIPKEWVDHVDSHVHLKKNSMETEAGWKTDASSCGCSS
jgi:hypothetical protein